MAYKPTFQLAAALLLAALRVHAADTVVDYHARRVRLAEKLKGGVARV